MLRHADLFPAGPHPSRPEFVHTVEPAFEGHDGTEVRVRAARRELRDVELAPSLRGSLFGRREPDVHTTGTLVSGVPRRSERSV